VISVENTEKELIGRRLIKMMVIGFVQKSALMIITPLLAIIAIRVKVIDTKKKKMMGSFFVLRVVSIFSMLRFAIIARNSALNIKESEATLIKKVTIGDQ
jgi:hypothetical protein